MPYYPYYYQYICTSSHLAANLEYPGTHHNIQTQIRTCINRNQPPDCFNIDWEMKEMIYLLS